MKPDPYRHILRLVLIGCATIAVIPAASPVLAADTAATSKQKLDFGNRLASVKALAEALAKDGGKPGVKETLASVSADTKEAEGLAAVGEHEIARAILDAAYRSLTTSLARLRSTTSPAADTQAGAGQDVAAGIRQREHVERTIRNTQTLIDALKRQNDEKAAGKGSEISGLEASTQQASKLLATGRIGEAATVIDTAYGRAKSAIASLQKPSDRKTGSAALDAARQESANANDSPQLRAIYARREATVAALLTSSERIAGESGSQPADIGTAATLLSRARNAANETRFPDAIAQLDSAYALLKQSIGSMRGGKELTASKQFATPSDEFRYELARNDDYQQLITQLLQARHENSWTEGAARGRSLRDKAERSAEAANWETALREIDASTGELKKILKNAGFPIM